VLFAGRWPASRWSAVLVRGGDPPGPPRGAVADSGISPLASLRWGCGFRPLARLDGVAGFSPLAPLAAGCGFPISGIWAARGAVGCRRDHRPAESLCNGALTDGCSLDAGRAGLQRGNQRDFHPFVRVG